LQDSASRIATYKLFLPDLFANQLPILCFQELTNCSSQLIVASPLCFHTLTNCFFRNPFPFTSMQIAGVSPHTKPVVEAVPTGHSNELGRRDDYARASTEYLDADGKRRRSRTSRCCGSAAGFSVLCPTAGVSMLLRYDTDGIEARCGAYHFNFHAHEKI
jgi:hypothetical protein